MQNLFAGQVGAAFYRTNRGAFDVLFLPQSQNFRALEILERRETNRYVYSFRGSPQPWAGNGMEGTPTFFVKYANQLFMTWDRQVKESLDQVFNSH